MTPTQQPLEVLVTSSSFPDVTDLPGAVGRAVPRRFTCWVSDAERGAAVELRLEVDDSVRVRELCLRGDQPLEPAAIGKLPFKRYVEAAIAQNVVQIDRVPGSRSVRITALGSTDDAMQSSRQATAGVGRRAVTPQRLARVAEIYRQALEKIAAGEEITTSGWVADHEHVSRGTARSLVAQARRAGFLGPALPRQAGEAQEGQR